MSAESEESHAREIENLKKWSKEYAEKNGFVLNPDHPAVERVLEGLLRNESKYGARYCPCRLRSGDRENDKAIICPCIYHRGEIKKDGHCKCMLFVRR